MLGKLSGTVNDGARRFALRKAAVYSKIRPRARDGARGANPLDRTEGTAMQKMVCTVCGYVYDPAKGDSGSGVKPGTPFEKLPDDWVCPVCGAGKDDFEKSQD
jgi:rubredoxin